MHIQRVVDVVCHLSPPSFRCVLVGGFIGYTRYFVVVEWAEERRGGGEAAVNGAPTHTQTYTFAGEKMRAGWNIQATAVLCVWASGKDVAQHVCITTIPHECPRLS